MAKRCALMIAILLVLPGVLWGGDSKPSASVTLERRIGYRNGDVVTARIAVKNLPKGFVFDGKALPQPGTKLNDYVEFAGWEREGDITVLRAQLFRLADRVALIAVPFPKMTFRTGDKRIKVDVPQAQILFAPLSSDKLLRLLPSLKPDAIDSLREGGPFSLFVLGAIIAVFALFVFVCDVVEKRKSPRISPYVAALRELKKLRKRPEEAWVEQCFAIFHRALDRRFGRVVFSNDPDVRYLGELGIKILNLSDRRLYHQEEVDVDRETLMAMMREFFTKMIWEEG